MPWNTHDRVDRISADRLLSSLYFCDLLHSGAASLKWQKNAVTLASLLGRKPPFKFRRWEGVAGVVGVAQKGVESPGSTCSINTCNTFIGRQQAQTCSTSVSARALAMCISLQISLCGFLLQRGFWGAIRTAINGSHKSKEPPVLAERWLSAISWITSAISKY